MVDLTKKGLTSWFERLPEDIRDSISSEIPDIPETVPQFCEKLTGAMPAEYKALVKEHEDLIVGLGRIGRIRLLSFLCANVYPFQAKIFHEIVHGSDDEGSEDGGSSKVQVLFIEDIKAFNDAIASRVFKSNTDSLALRALQEAAYEHTAPSSPF